MAPHMNGEKSETAVVRQALDYLPARFPGCKVWRANSGGNKSGRRKANSINLPDIVGIQRFGMGLFVEVKTETGRLKPEQAAFLREMHERGCYAGVYVPGALHQWGTVPEKYMPPKPRASA